MKTEETGEGGAQFVIEHCFRGALLLVSDEVLELFPGRSFLYEASEGGLCEAQDAYVSAALFRVRAVSRQEEVLSLRIAVCTHEAIDCHEILSNQEINLENGHRISLSDDGEIPPI